MSSFFKGCFLGKIGFIERSLGWVDNIHNIINDMIHV